MCLEIRSHWNILCAEDALGGGLGVRDVEKLSYRNICT